MAAVLAIAVGIWWTANTIAHLFIHRPFFRRPFANACTAVVLTIVMGIPQSLWRERHLAHHTGRPHRLRPSADLLIQSALVLSSWTVLAFGAPVFFLWTYLPGYLGALALCALHGYYEHAAGTTSHYGRLYNLLCFNDGYHVEHHRFPGERWRRLPSRREAASPGSAWPAPLRWLDALNLERLERIVLRSRVLQAAVLRAHARALGPMLASLDEVRDVAIVGGGLFPRTALIVRSALPKARITIIDCSRANLERARAVLGHDDRVTFVHARYRPAEIASFDLAIFPLSFDADRDAIYAHPPARAVIVHDWIWRRRGTSRVVSLGLLKRVNLVPRPEASAVVVEDRIEGAQMRIAGAIVVLAISRVAMLSGHHLEWSWWSPIAYLWQDAAALLALVLVDRYLLRERHVAWAVYTVFVMYLAMSVPVARVMSTPMTWPMWRAARSALSDSVWHYVTPANLLWICLLTAAAAVAPWRLRRIPVRLLVAASSVLVIVGPSAASRVETRGLERNAWSALVISATPGVEAVPLASDWRRTRMDAGRLDDLSAFRGAAAGRNVVLVSLESTAAQYLALYGATPDVMPNLSKLATSAIVFDNAYAVYPESVKGLFSILCSTYPAFDIPVSRYAETPCASVAAALSRRGYRTGLFHSGRFGYLGMEGIVRNRGFETLEDAGDIGGNHESSFGVDDRSTVARVLAWIDTLGADDRFFVTYLPIAGHHPYEVSATGPFPGRGEFDRYRNALRYGDTALGDLIDGLETRRLQQRTLWIVLGDHGEAFGQHDGNVGHTFQLYEENVHVPLLVAAPGLVPRQRRSPRVVSLVDIAPTILDLAGVPAPASFQGRSALDGERRMALFYSDYSLRMAGARDGSMKYICELDSGRSRLFDLARDPGETRNLSADYPAEVGWYGERLRGWSAAQKNLFTKPSVSR